MATKVRFGRVEMGRYFGFSFEGEVYFFVESFNNGIMKLHFLAGTDIEAAVQHVVGCFEEGSDFYGVKAIEFNCNGTHVSVNAENAEVGKIMELLSKPASLRTMEILKEHGVKV